MAGAGMAVRRPGGAEPGAVARPQAPHAAHPVLSLVGRRAAVGLVTLLVVSAVVFAATEVLPGNAANAVLGRTAAANPVALHRLEAALHLNRGLLDQYWIWFSGLFTGHLGHSLVNGQPVWGYIQPRLINSAVLMLVARVLGAGRIVEAGPASLLFPRPLHPYTRGLLDSVPTPDGAGRLAGIPGQQPTPGQRGPGCTFAPRCDLVLDECRAREPEPVMLSGRKVRCRRAMEPTTEPPLRPARAAMASAPPGTAVLSLRNVCASYGSVPVLSAIDLDVPMGSCIAIVGESGSGKTTLARCIVGLHRNWTGGIALHGTPLAHSARYRPALALKQIQCVFQNPYTSLNPRKTIGQIVAEPLQRFLGLPRGEQTGRVTAALGDVSLGSGFLDRYPDQLSGGERQRVAIARALVVEPELLVCDEVTSALDVSVQAVIVELLRAVTDRRHLAMVFITHNLALVRSVAQTAMVLRQGEIVEAGPAGQVLAHPASDYTTRLMADVPRLARPEAGR